MNTKTCTCGPNDGCTDCPNKTAPPSEERWECGPHTITVTYVEDANNHVASPLDAPDAFTRRLADAWNRGYQARDGQKSYDSNPWASR